MKQVFFDTFHLKMAISNTSGVHKMQRDEIFDRLEEAAHKVSKVPFGVNRYLGSLSFETEEGEVLMNVLDYINTWCCVFPSITEEQISSVGEQGYEIYEDGGYFWDLGEKGTLSEEDAERLIKACETFFTILF